MEPYVDLSDGASFVNGFPHDSFTWLRKCAPVYWHAPTPATPDGEGFWVVSRYEDVVAIFKDPKTFSSDTGGHREHGGTTLHDDKSSGLVLNTTDDPKHRRLRSLVTQGFTPRTIGRLEDEFRRITCGLLDGAAQKGSFDFVHEVARELPLQAICTILGVPEADRTQLIEWVDLGVSAEGNDVIAPEYLRKVGRYALELIAEKRRAPVDDILSIITHATLPEEPEGRLTDFELRLFFNILFPAGVETTRSAIGTGLLAFIQHPEEWAKLKADPGLIGLAIEEIVRWTTPSIFKRRTVTQDTIIHGQKIRAGDKVAVWEMSANRDENIFDDPFTFNIERKPNPHIGYGTGVHVCLGAALARLELKIMFEELVRRFDHFEVVDEYEWVPNNRLHGLRSLQVNATVNSAAS